MVVLRRRLALTAALVAMGLQSCDRLFPYAPRPTPGAEAGVPGDDGPQERGIADGPAALADGPGPWAEGPPVPPGDGTPPSCAADSVLCGAVCVSGADCRGCAPTLPLLCRIRNECVARCQDCAPATPIECFACNASQKEPIGTCEADDVGGFCRSGDYSSAYLGGPGEHCDCSNTVVSKCPGAHQVCVEHGSTDWCVTCGELTEATEGLGCRGGGTCDTTLVPPRCQ